MKPMLACDYVERKLRFPLCVQPKIDGVRGLNLFGTLTGRSLKKFGNRSTVSRFSHSQFVGFDGELAVGDPCSSALCRDTASALGQHEGSPEVSWHLFDMVRKGDENRPYVQRYAYLDGYVRNLKLDARNNPSAYPVDLLRAIAALYVVPMYTVNTLSQLNELDAHFLEQGFEGTIVRAQMGIYKFGRSTATEGGLLRIKRFVEEDAVVNSISQGQTNLNEAQTNALGQTERSTHQENMVPNGMVGTLHCTDVKTGQKIDVGAGCLTHSERRDLWEHPDRIIGKTIKYKFFPKGVKDKPRFPTFQAFRMEEDK